MNNENFVKCVKEYILLDDQIKEAMKDIKVIKDRKLEIGNNILAMMKTEGIDCCNLDESGSKLVVKKSKSTSSLKPSLIEQELMSVIDDKGKVDSFMETLNSKREVKEKDMLSRSTKKKPKSK